MMLKPYIALESALTGLEKRENHIETAGNISQLRIGR